VSQSPEPKLRAEGAAISSDGAGKIAEPVPSVSAGILLRVCFGYASQPLAFLAMTGGTYLTIIEKLVAAGLNLAKLRI